MKCIISIALIFVLLPNLCMYGQTQSIEQLKTCAKAGDLDCMIELANRLVDHQGGGYSPYEALQWYEQAARTQDTLANIHLAAYLLYLAPEELHDYGRAATILNGYFGADLPQVYFLMGYAYHFGLGVTTNREEAFKQYLKASYYAYGPALYSCGYLLYKGEGVEQDYVDAAVFFQGAYDVGDPNAAYMLGECYRNGYGVSQDFVEAWQFYTYAAQKGNPAAQKILVDAQNSATQLKPDWIDPQLSPEEIAVLNALETQPECETDLHSLTGEWKGKLLIQEFSKTKVLEAIPITFEIVKADPYDPYNVIKEPIKCRLTDSHNESPKLDLCEMTAVWGTCGVSGGMNNVNFLTQSDPMYYKAWNPIYDIQWIAEDLSSLTINNEKYLAIHYRTYDSGEVGKGNFVTLVLHRVSMNSEYELWLADLQRKLKKMEEIRLSVSPNPVGQAQNLEITFELFRPHPVVIDLLDVSGNVIQRLKDENIQTWGPQTFQADISKAGAQFFIRVTAGEQIASEYIVR